jgi:predicted RNA binding protein YcfA (HicA-like mRNA interferase family)
MDSQRLIKILENFGLSYTSERLPCCYDEEKTRILMPAYLGREVKPGLVRAIMREAGISREELFKILKWNDNGSAYAGMALRGGCWRSG